MDQKRPPTKAPLAATAASTIEGPHLVSPSTKADSNQELSAHPDGIVFDQRGGGDNPQAHNAGRNETLPALSFMKTFLSAPIQSDNLTPGGSGDNSSSTRRKVHNSYINSQVSRLSSNSTSKSGRENRLRPWSTSTSFSYNWNQFDLERYVTRLVNVKPRVDCAEPDLRLHSYINYKKLQAIETKEKELKLRNERIAKNIVMASRNTSSCKPHVDCWNSLKIPSSPNPQAKVRERELKRIEKDNEILAERINKAIPFIQTRPIQATASYKEKMRDPRLRSYPPPLTSAKHGSREVRHQPLR